jgi:hypothetical protein
MPAIAAQLPGHLRRRCPLGDPSKDQPDLRGGPLSPLQDGSGPGIEDPAASPALVVQHRLAVTAMDSQGMRLSALGASQAIGVEQFDEPRVAGILIEDINQGEIHG